MTPINSSLSLSLSFLKSCNDFEIIPNKEESGGGGEGVGEKTAPTFWRVRLSPGLVSPAAVTTVGRACQAGDTEKKNAHGTNSGWHTHTRGWQVTQRASAFWGQTGTQPVAGGLPLDAVPRAATHSARPRSCRGCSGCPARPAPPGRRPRPWCSGSTVRTTGRTAGCRSPGRRWTWGKCPVSPPRSVRQGGRPLPPSELPLGMSGGPGGHRPDAWEDGCT